MPANSRKQDPFLPAAVACALVLIGVLAWLTVAVLTGLDALALPARPAGDQLRRVLLLQVVGGALVLGSLVALLSWWLNRRLSRRITAMRRELADTTITRDYLSQILRGMHEALIVIRDDGRIVRVNPAACALTAREEQTLLGAPLATVMDSAMVTSLLANGHDPRPREAAIRRENGSSLPVSLTCSAVTMPEADFTGFVIAAQDISERKRAEQRIRYLARIDSLTKVANRMQFQHLLQRAIARARRQGRYLALLYIDIDRFKDINDTYGHLAGDISLEHFTHRLLAALPEKAIVGRLAGDEFAVVIEDLGSLDETMSALRLASERILAGLAQPLQIHGQEIHLSASIGMARYPIDGGDVIELIRNADAALYEAKKPGGNRAALYTPEMNAKVVERLILKSKLRRALEQDELTLRYQPKYSLKTGKVVGAEALVRWDMPERGLIPPGEFVPLAEETNLILQLGSWVLNRVCDDYLRWQRSVASPGRISVNLSLKQLRQPEFLRQVTDIFRGHGLSPTCVELEITETTLMEDVERTIRLLDELYAMGLHLAIDDFGTGYSSLSALQQFPITTLKIDKSFVRHAATDREDATIVTTIIQMAHSLGMEVVAEGVETSEQLEFLRRTGCDYVQGMLFGEPFAAAEYAALLQRQVDGTDVHRVLFG